MSHYYTSHIGILKYLSREFRAAAQAESNGDRFGVYAQLLERMADDLLVSVNPPGKSSTQVGNALAGC